jgi:hypothetical protein
MQVCNYCNVDLKLEKFQKRKNGAYHKQCTKCGNEKAVIAKESRIRLQKQKQVCIDCDDSKSVLKFYTVGDQYHDKCIACCDGIEYVCGGCVVVKELAEFYVRKDTNKPRGECKQCVLQRKQGWRNNNVEHNKQTAKAYRERPDIKEKSKEYQAILYRTPGHKEHKATLARISSKKRYHTDPNYRMKKIMRARFKELVYAGYKKESVMTLLGCSPDHLFKWINFQFDENMNWENQGDYWHMDHIKPCASFNFEDINDQKECFHWTNLQPLFKTENIIKSDTYNDSIKDKAHATLQKFIYCVGNDFLKEEQSVIYDTTYVNLIDDLDE